VVSVTSTLILPVRRSTGNRSGEGKSHQSISPVCNAPAAAALSGMTIHSTRSKLATLPPAVMRAGSLARGT